MTFKEYGKWLAVGLFGFMGLSWDAGLFLSIIVGKGQATICEPNTAIVWGEFIGISLLSLFVLVVVVRHVAGTRVRR